MLENKFIVFHERSKQKAVTVDYRVGLPVETSQKKKTCER
jgi:hypothetical protein